MSRLITTDSRFAMFCFYCILKDHPRSTSWNGEGIVIAPFGAEMMESYAQFLKNKFPLTLGGSIYRIEPS